MKIEQIDDYDEIDNKGFDQNSNVVHTQVFQSEDKETEESRM